MGQKPSHLLGGGTTKSKLSISWLLRGGQQTTRTPNPEQPIKFQYKTRRKTADHPKTPEEIGGLNNNLNVNRNLNNNLKNPKVNDLKCQIVKTQNVPTRTKSEPSLAVEKVRERHRHRKKNGINSNNRCQEPGKSGGQQFGYEIDDLNAFLTKATIEKPANIPVVLAFPSVLYQTRTGGYQAEIQLPLGMVVNAVFKNQNWLYVQTPHAEEGYVSYAACLPLGIIPPPEDSPTPCWENTTDVFPKPSGNMTDTEKLSSRSECSAGRCRSRRSRNAMSSCGERSFDRLYLQAAAGARRKGVRQTLLVMCCDYDGKRENTLKVAKGDVVALVSNHLADWFWVRNREGAEGFIPAAVAGHGFL